MAWSVIRKATEEDRARLRAASVRFAARHGFGELPPDVVDLNTAGVLPDAYPGCSMEEELRAKRLMRLWKPVMRRALRHSTADGIAYGTVGWSVQ